MNQFYDDFFFGSGFLGIFGYGKKSNALKDAKIKKNWSGLTIFYMILNIVVNMLRFKLPKSMSSRYMIMTLIDKGVLGITRIKDYKYSEDGELMNLSLSDMNNNTPYGLPLNVGLTDYTGKNYGRFIPYSPNTRDIANCALVYWNINNVPPIYRILWYAQRLTELQSSISASIANLKGTIVIRCEKEQENTVKKAWLAAGEGLPVIFTYSGSENFGSQPELLCNNVTGEILKQLMETYDKTVADFCTEFGLNANMVMNKLSGVSDKELETNDQRNDIVLNGIIKSIRDGFNDAIELFGENMSVEWNFEEDIENDDEDENKEEKSDTVIEEIGKESDNVSEE